MSEEWRDGAWTQGTRRRSRCAVPEEGGVTGATIERAGVGGVSEEWRDGAWTQGTRRRSRCAVPEEGGVTGATIERAGVVA